MANIRRRGEIALNALGKILSQAIEENAPIVSIIAHYSEPEYRIVLYTKKNGNITLEIPSCIHDIIALTKMMAKIDPNNKKDIQMGDLHQKRREFFLPIYILVKVIPCPNKSEEIRLHIA